MKVLYPITLDVKKTNVQKVIHANQGEGLDRKLIVTLVSGSEPIILDNENQSVQFVAKKPDGTTIYNATAIKDGKVIIYLTSQTVAAVGDVDCQLEVVSTDEGSVGSGVIYSAKFTIAVEEALYDEETIESSNEFTELIELIERAEKQVTVFTGEDTPSTDPDEYDNIKPGDFYFRNSTQYKDYYFAKSVDSEIVWDTLVKGSMFSDFTQWVTTQLTAKADKSTTYTKTDVDTALLTKADKSTTYTKTEVDAELDTDRERLTWLENTKQDNLTAGNGINISNDEISVKLYNSQDNGLIFNSDGTLALYKSILARDTSFRSYLADIAVQNALASKSYVDEKLSGRLKKLIVTELPTEDIDKDTIYMILRSAPTTNNIYDEYLYVLKSTNPDVYDWELIGNTEVDLTNYYTKTEVDTALGGKQNKIDSTHKLDADNVDDTNSTNKFTNATEKAAWNAKQNAIDSTHKLDADLIEDGEVNKTVTAQEKSLWNSSHNVIIDSASGSSITLPDSTETAFNQIYLYGKSTQTGTPTIDNPIPIVDVTSEEIEVTDGTNTQTAELDITLRGIPVASGGNYTDANNQQWICDTIERYKDGSGKHIQRVGVKVLDGTETWIDHSNNRVYARINIEDSNSNNPKTLFTHCTLERNATAVGNTDNTYIQGGGSFICSPTQNGTRLTVSQWATFLETSNATIYYPLETPIETPLTAEQIAELNLDAYYPETQITSTPDITVYYICDLKNYIDKISS